MYIGLTKGLGLCLGPGLVATLMLWKGPGWIGAIPLYNFTLFPFVMLLLWGALAIMTVVIFAGTTKMEVEESVKRERNHAKLIKLLKGVRVKDLKVLLDLDTIQGEGPEPSQWSEAVHQALVETALERQVTIPEPKNPDDLKGQDPAAYGIGDSSSNNAWYRPPQSEDVSGLRLQLRGDRYGPPRAATGEYHRQAHPDPPGQDQGPPVRTRDPADRRQLSHPLVPPRSAS